MTTRYTKPIRSQVMVWIDQTEKEVAEKKHADALRDELRIVDGPLKTKRSLDAAERAIARTNEALQALMQLRTKQQESEK